MGVTVCFVCGHRILPFRSATFRNGTYVNTFRSTTQEDSTQEDSLVWGHIDGFGAIRDHWTALEKVMFVAREESANFRTSPFPMPVTWQTAWGCERV